MSFRCLLCCFPLSLMDESSSPIGGTPRLLRWCCGCLSLLSSSASLTSWKSWCWGNGDLSLSSATSQKAIVLQRMTTMTFSQAHNRRAKEKKKKVRSIRNEVFIDKTKISWEYYFVPPLDQCVCLPLLELMWEKFARYQWMKFWCILR